MNTIEEATKVIRFKNNIESIFRLMHSKRQPTINDINIYIQDYGTDSIESFVLDFLEGEGCFRGKAIKGLDYDISVFDGTDLEYVHLLDTCRFPNIKDGDVEKWAKSDDFKVIPQDELPKQFDKAFRKFLGLSKDGSYADVLWLDTPLNRASLNAFAVLNS